jgi:Uma2 family endonuclease
MSTQSKHLLTPEEYLEVERKAEFKSEYYQGRMFAMAGAGWEHNIIVGGLIRVLGQQTLEGPCAVAPSDIRIKVSATGLYTYPDVVVVCGEPQFADNRRDTVLNPTFIVEVLSPSTEAYDRGRIFENYRSLESLKTYLLVASDRIHADLYTRRRHAGSGIDRLPVYACRVVSEIRIAASACGRLTEMPACRAATLARSGQVNAGKIKRFFR